MENFIFCIERVCRPYLRPLLYGHGHTHGGVAEPIQATIGEGGPAV